jgi:hypothetical protein
VRPRTSETSANLSFRTIGETIGQVDGSPPTGSSVIEAGLYFLNKGRRPSNRRTKRAQKSEDKQAAPAVNRAVCLRRGAALEMRELPSLSGFMLKVLAYSEDAFF